MNPNLAQEAISHALSGNWEEAVNVNKKILKENPKDLATLNRIARAYSELGQINKAKTYAQKVIKIDPFNSIANKALKKWKGLKEGEIPHVSTFYPEAFLEEPGKTKLFSLMHLGGPSVLGQIDCGDEIKLDYHCHRVAAETLDGKYIGRLSDDISSRLKKLTQLGNEYHALIKSSEPNDVKIFIKEIKKGKKAEKITSFPTEKIDYVAFTPPDLVRKQETQISQEEQEE